LCSFHDAIRWSKSGNPGISVVNLPSSEPFRTDYTTDCSVILWWRSLQIKRSLPIACATEMTAFLVTSVHVTFPAHLNFHELFTRTTN